MEPNKEIQNEQNAQQDNEVKAESNAFVEFFQNKKNLYIVIAVVAVIVVAIVAAIIAFGGQEAPNAGNGDTPGITNPDDGNGGEEGGEGEEGGNNDEGSSIPENTTGAALYNSFVAALEANNNATALELAETLAYNSGLPFMPGASEIGVGAEYFAGFDNYTITGYKSASTFGPMVGSIPFIGYIFELADDTNADDFVKALKDNCNPAWNICVEADQVVAEIVGNKVFFLMCPADLGNEGGEDIGGGDVALGDVIYPVTLEEGTLGYSYWMAFEDMMSVNPENTAISLAQALCEAWISPFSLMPMEMPVGTEYFAGFDNYTITDYKSCAVYMPMIGSIPFVGYIFELEDGVDVHNFISDLTANSNTRWLICEEADEKLVGAYDNFVFFLMCPANVDG